MKQSASRCFPPRLAVWRPENSAAHVSRETGTPGLQKRPAASRLTLACLLLFLAAVGHAAAHEMPLPGGTSAASRHGTLLPPRPDEYRLTWDPTGSASAGADCLVALHGILIRAEEAAVPLQISSAQIWYATAANVVYRAAKIGLLDLVVDQMLMLVQHEVFGHGARCRELGYVGTTYSFSPFYPYGDGTGLTRYGTPPECGTTKHEQMLRTLAGNEASWLLADQFIRQWVERGRIHYREAVLYLLSSNNLSYYILSTYLRSRNEPTNDITNYLGDINAYYAGKGYPGLIPPGTENEQLTVETLASHSLTVAANPFQYFAAWTLFYRYLWLGQPQFAFPSFGDRDWSYVPLFRFGLSPFGIEYYLDNYFTIGRWPAMVYVRVGNPTFAPSWGAGVDGETPWFLNVMKLRAAAHVWCQPELFVDGAEARRISEGPGMAVEAGLTLRLPSSPWTATIAGSYKTDGYMEGETLERGFVVRVGFGLLLSPPNTR